MGERVRRRDETCEIDDTKGACVTSPSRYDTRKLSYIQKANIVRIRKRRERERRETAISVYVSTVS